MRLDSNPKPRCGRTAHPAQHHPAILKGQWRGRGRLSAAIVHPATPHFNWLSNAPQPRRRILHTTAPYLQITRKSRRSEASPCHQEGLGRRRQGNRTSSARRGTYGREQPSAVSECERKAAHHFAVRQPLTTSTRSAVRRARPSYGAATTAPYVPLYKHENPIPAIAPPVRTPLWDGSGHSSPPPASG